MIPLIGCLLVSAQGFHAPQAETELVPSVTSITPGVTFQIALHMKMAPGWHSYYSNPGESGMATKIVWDLPKGFKAGPIKWPMPKRIEVGGVAQFVYEHEVWLVTDISTPSKYWNTQRPLPILANVSWLLCSEVCVPQKSKLYVNVPDESGYTRMNPAFTPAANAIVDPAKHEGLVASVRSGGPVTLSINRHTKQPARVRFFPADATYFGAAPAAVKATETGISLSIPLSTYASSTPNRLTGILVIPDSGAKGGAEWIDIPVKKH